MASLLPSPVFPTAAAAAASTSSSSRCRCRCRITTSSSAHGWSNCQGWRLHHRVWAAQAADQQGGVQQQQQQEENEDGVVDSNVLPYCSINRKEKKTIGEMEQEFLQALQARALPCPSLLLNPATSYLTYTILTSQLSHNLIRLDSSFSFSLGLLLRQEGRNVE
jgi:hypothetical protein